MGEFKRERKFGGSRSFGRNSSRRPSRGNYGGFDRSDSDRPRRNRSDDRRPGFDRQMHTVICDKCGESCEVPFRPTEGKPVYCNNCFKKTDNFSSRNSNQSKEDLDQINAKLDKILKALKID